VFYISLFLLSCSRRGGVFEGALVSASSLGLASFFGSIISHVRSYQIQQHHVRISTFHQVEVKVIYQAHNSDFRPYCSTSHHQSHLASNIGNYTVPTIGLSELSPMAVQTTCNYIDVHMVGSDDCRYVSLVATLLHTDSQQQTLRHQDSSSLFEQRTLLGQGCLLNPFPTSSVRDFHTGHECNGLSPRSHD
jgi:hypothetical protein